MATPPSKRPRLAILVNVVAPYRVPLYEHLGLAFDTTVFYSGREGNREAWQGTLDQLRHCRSRPLRGWTKVVGRAGDDGAIDRQHVHFDWGLLGALIHFRPRAVITIELGFRTLMALAYGSVFRKPVFVWWGGTRHTERHVSSRKRRFRQRMARRIRHWISYGETSTKYLLDLGVERSRITQIQNSIDESLYSAEGATRYEIRPRPVLVYVGQMIRRKGLDRLLAAMERLQHAGAEFSLLLVGSGVEQAELEAEVQRRGLKHVTFAGSVPASEMAGVYRSADALVFPTLEDVWGLVVNEAILCGKPAMVSKYAGCVPEIVPPENVFDPLDPDDFDRALRQALEGRLASADPGRLLTSEQVAERIQNALNESIGNPGR